MPRAARRAPPAHPAPPPPAPAMQPLPLAHYIANPTPAFTEHLALSGSCRKCPGKHPDPGKKGGKGKKRGKGKKVKFADPIEEVEGEEEGDEDDEGEEAEDGAEEDEEGDEEEVDEWQGLEEESEGEEGDVTIEEQDQPEIPDAQIPPTQNASKAAHPTPDTNTNNTNSATLPPRSTADETGLAMLLQAVQAVENVQGVANRTLTPKEQDAAVGLLGLREWRGGDEVFGERVMRG